MNKERQNKHSESRSECTPGVQRRGGSAEGERREGEHEEIEVQACQRRGKGPYHEGDAKARSLL